MANGLPQSAFGIMGQNFPSLTQEDGKYTGSDMDYTYGDTKQKMQSYRDDIRILLARLPSHAVSIAYDYIRNKHSPGLNEELTDIAGMLPFNSPLRNHIQGRVVSTLYNSLQHPPASYLGNKHQYRTADGSHHNFMFPDFGKAGMPYAKTVRSAKKLHGVKPDAGMLFDLLEARPDGHFRANESGISSMFLYHATILIHDLFNTNRQNSDISDTSSYLDLAPLYGSNQAEQDKVRLGKDGLLKPDTFHEDRLLGQPPGVNVLLVLYSRFHNYVATMLKEINEDNRFTERPNKDFENKQDPPRDPKKALDNDLFQTARLIVGGLYINISLGDYLRAIQGVHEKDTTWTFDPRMYIDKTAQGEGLPRGMGNQVSAEFNLLYRFHSAISKNDAEWTENFLTEEAVKRLNKKRPVKIGELTPKDLWTMLGSFAAEKRAIEPCKRDIEGVKRGPDGTFPDNELAEVLKKSIDDTAGAFGARNVPKALRAIEIAGIIQARKWEVASLNEFRTFFGLEPHATFESVNADPEIRNALENLYDSPDMIEMYPGIFIEGAAKIAGVQDEHAKKRGVAFPATAGRGVLSDAVTLVRSDRFYTIDYTTATLTNWGLCEVASDYKTLGGSMLHKLFHRGLPGHFAFNSVYAMQPMYISEANRKILERLGTIDQFSLDPPGPPKPKAIIKSHAAIHDILADKEHFESPWSPSLGSMVSKEALQGLAAFENELCNHEIYNSTESKQIYLAYLIGKAESYVKERSFCLAGSYYQIDMVRDVAIPLNARFLAELFSLNVKTSTNQSGAHTSSELYKMLIEVRNWIDYPNADRSAMWYRRRKAQESAVQLTKTTTTSMVKVFHKPWAISSWFNWGTTAQTKDENLSKLQRAGASIAESLHANGRTHEDNAQTAWMLAVSGAGTPVTAFTEVLEYFLSDKGKEHWPKIRELAKQESAKAVTELGVYFMEALRLSSEQVHKRIVQKDGMKIANENFEPKQEVMLLMSRANKDGDVFDNPDVFKLNRDPSHYLHYGFGPAGQLGKNMLLVYGTALLKVAGQMDNIRKAPGQMGELKKVQQSKEQERKTQLYGRHYMTADWGYLVAEPTTWKLHFDKFGGEALLQETKKLA